MARPQQPRLPAALLAELQGLDWTLQCGKRHWQLRIAGRLVGILPHGTDTEHGRAVRNTIAQVRRVKRG